MDSEVTGIALFSEGRSPEENSVISVTEETIISTRASKQCMIYLFYIPPTNILVGNHSEARQILLRGGCHFVVCLRLQRRASCRRCTAVDAIYTVVYEADTDSTFTHYR